MQANSVMLEIMQKQHVQAQETCNS